MEVEKTRPASAEKALLAIVRIRGSVNVRPEVERALRHLRLTRRYSMVIFPADKPGLEGMLRVASSWITWGEINREVLIEVLRRRGRVPGGARLTDEYVKSRLGLSGIEELADKLLSSELELHKLEAYVKPVFRLSPPRGGFKRTIKKPISSGGETGYRGNRINELILRML